VYPHYAWIIYSFYPDKWWTEEVAKEHLEECSDQELEDFLLKSHALIIHLVPEPDDWNRLTVAGLSTTDFNTIYKETLAQSGHSAIAAHALAFDATWALGQALSYTEQMRIQIMTVNGALNDSNCSNWSRNEKVCAELSQIFQEKCNLVNIIETRNATLAQVITNKTCDSFNVSHLKNLSTEDVINHANCSRDNVVQIFQDCMVKELAQYTNCEGMDGGLVPLNEFNYSNTFMGCVIRYNLQQTNFVGMSGPVRFAASGTLVYTSVWLLQERGNKSTTGIANTRGVRFGYLDRTSNFSLKFDEGESVETIFPDGIPPDGTPVHITHTYKTGVTVVFYVIALCGVVFSVVCFAFNFIFREKKVIRLTTPKLNFVIFSGAVLMYLSVFIGLLPTVDENVVHAQCTVHVWLYVVGYLLVYGPILAKMWRVYQIFHNPTPGKKILKTWHLLCVVGGICCVGVLLILAKTIAQSITTPELVPDSEHRNGTTSSDILEVYSVWQCYESRSAPFYLDLVIFLYLILLQIVGIILAFQTRKVKINVLNDSKSVAALVYISSIVLVVIVLVTFILRSYINISAALFSTGIIVLATVFLILMFIPKMYSLYRDPMGEKVFKDTNPTHQPHTDTTGEHHSMAMGLTELTAVEKVDLLDARVKALESIVEEKNQKIYELINA
jgi:gamma-aminobutyric acid type B receptor